MKKRRKKDALQIGKLVTVAIHTYEKAQILQSILDSGGIMSQIQEVNLIEPSLSGNFRVRINEVDLPDALRIIEQVDFRSNIRECDEEVVSKSDEIVIPIDFSDYTLKACEFGFKLAYDLKCSVRLIHVFFTPFYPAAAPFSDSFTIHATDKDFYHDVRAKTEGEMKSLASKIDKAIEDGAFPRVRYFSSLIEGLAEDEIISYSKKIRPTAIVMGTRGKSAKELDLLGSVTAEVMDGCRTPIFAIPEDAKVSSPAEIKRIVFLTNFQEREFKALDIMMNFLKSYRVELFLAHIAKKEDIWNEIKLAGLKNHLSELYPNLVAGFKLIDQSESLEETVEKYVMENSIDLISLSSSRRNIFARMFNPGIARKMLFHSDTPLLVIKGM